MHNMTGVVRRCIDDYNMIKKGDRIAVGVSGGKDSLTLLCAMAELRGYYPQKFELEAITLDLGYEGTDFHGVGDLCRSLEVPYTVVKTQIGPIIFDIRHEKNPCSMCAKMRRGVLNEEAAARGCGKVALAHNFDDAVETFLMSLIFEGRISCFQPVTFLSRVGVTQIRPLIYAGEKSTADYAAKNNLPIVHNVCPANGFTKRQETKELIRELGARYPDLKDKILGAMQRLPLDGWGTEE